MTRETRERLLLLAAGASLSLAALLLLTPGQPRRSRTGSGEDLEPAPGGVTRAEPSKNSGASVSQPAWKSFGDGLRDEWSEWMERRTPPEVDPHLLMSRLSGLPGGAAVQVGVLAPGIVEVVGTVSGPDESRELLAAAAQVPGVRTVVNRLWIEGDVE